jgi:hypothetical protein
MFLLRTPYGLQSLGVKEMLDQSFKFRAQRAWRGMSFNELVCQHTGMPSSILDIDYAKRETFTIPAKPIAGFSSLVKTDQGVSGLYQQPDDWLIDRKGLTKDD